MSARHRLLVWASWTVLVASLSEAATPDDASALRASSRAEAKGLSSIESLIEADWIDQDARFTILSGKPAVKPDPGEMTTALDAAGGCDGVKTGRFGFHTASQEQDPWWQVDLESVVELDRIVIYNRTDAPPERTRHIRVLVAPNPAGPFSLVYQHDGEVFFGVKEGKPLVVRFGDKAVSARIVRLDVPGRCSMALDEIEVYGRNDPQRNIALGRPADQKSIGPYSRSEQPSTELPKETPRPALPAFSLEHSQDVLHRARALADRLRARADPARLGPLVVELDELDARVRGIKADKDVPEAIRRDIYIAARRLARRIAFTNPVLDFDRILFIKRHDPAGLYHMVHQYYGFGAVPGGGLFVLSNPFSDDPRVDDLLANSRVEQGALRGQRLVPGSFLSPELSFDGRTILFAYTQAQGEKPEWSSRASYHIFKCDADGRNLVQLTDGPWNEFDPCYLPSGRIAFISERRGGYLRCGGSAPPWDSPTYTLHSMAADGSDVVCLSFHETQEWQPSVDHEGMIVYTRWDYVDRDTNVAHHLWNCFPDGRDPRSFHGNYPVERESRPWMEMNARAVPGSNKIMAVAAAHHGHEFGSLVLIDYRPEDDGAMSQVERFTPDVPLPEAEGGKAAIRQNMVYGTPWPLSEDDCLCVYGADAGNRGIYWVDRFGNRELLYRDPEITCLSPIPLRPRPVPPVIADATVQTADARRAAAGDMPPATMAVMNVYDSDFTWPAEVRVAALRIIQLLPKTTPPADRPRIGVAVGTNARAVLGTVPVEPDGSAYFEAPAAKLLYFQALDERGLAIQSMRSATYVHPGEQLSCQGCHEPKRRASQLKVTPLALRRPPSKIQPDVAGSNPFSFVRLVQPVLDRHCVSCHAEKKAIDLSAAIDGPYGWTRSYTALSKDFGFSFHSSNGSIRGGVHGGSRTVPGQFGARASRLLEYLDKHHYGVNLPREDRHRITLWLDCNSEFYGAYEHPEAQAQGQVVYPSLE